MQIDNFHPKKVFCDKKEKLDDEEAKKKNFAVLISIENA